MPSTPFNQWSLAFEPHFPLWINVLALLFLMASLWLSFLSSKRLGPSSLRWILLGLRVLALMAVYLLLFRPALDLRKAQEIPGVLAVLVDRSASMALKSGELSRAEWVRTSLVKGKTDLESLGKNIEVQYFTFGEKLQASSYESLTDAKQKSELSKTDLQSSLDGLREFFSQQQHPLAGVFLFSDGADRGTLGARFQVKSDLSGLKDFPAPIYTFQPGSEKDFWDLRIQDVRFDEFGFVKTPIVVEAEIEMDGFEKRTVPVTLLEGKEVISSTSVEMSEENNPQIAKFQFSPQSLGTHIYTLQVPEYSEEVVRENNRKNIVIRVIRDKIRVLHVAGHPSWDEKFLRLAMKRDPNIDLIAFYILRTKDDLLHEVDQDELSLIPFPINKLFGPDLETFDLAIFQDFDYRKFDFSTYYLTNIVEFVEKGGSFMMMGGGNSFAQGGYADSPLAKILPLSLQEDGADYQKGSFSMKLTEAGKRHPITRLHPDIQINAGLWGGMPMLMGMNTLGKELSGAIVLGTGQNGNGRESPLLAVREVDKGRTMVLNTDSSWQWNFLRVRDGGTSESYFTFFKNAIRWLVGDPTESLVDVETSQSQIQENESVKIVVQARDRSYKANAKARVKLMASKGSEERVIVEREGKTNDLGRYETDLTFPESGHYRVTVQVQLPDQGLAQGETVLAVEGVQGEWLQPRIHSQLLRVLAEKTKGKYTVLPSSLHVKLNPQRDYQILDRKVIPLWNTFAGLFFASIFLFCEWWLRRRNGLM